MKNFVFVTQAVLLILVGSSAAISGALMILFPSGEIFQAPREMLKNSPFSDFLIPGIILFLVNGAGQLIAGVLTFRKHRLAGFFGAVFGLGMMIWIFVQVNMIGGGHVLQYGYFFIGVIEAALSYLINDYLTEESSRVAKSI